MGPVSFVMVLIGCGQGTQCEPIATLPVAYATQASCLAAQPEILAVSNDLGYTRVMAECRNAVPASATQRAKQSVSTS